jgi:hypothetical protein
MKRLLLTTATLALLSTAAIGGLAFIASTRQPGFNERWNNANTDLMATPHSIPRDKLHRHGMQILRERAVAKDDEASQ